MTEPTPTTPTPATSTRTTLTTPIPMGWTREGKPVVLREVLSRAVLIGAMPGQGKTCALWAFGAERDTTTVTVTDPTNDRQNEVGP